MLIIDGGALKKKIGTKQKKQKKNPPKKQTKKNKKKTQKARGRSKGKKEKGWASKEKCLRCSRSSIRLLEALAKM